MTTRTPEAAGGTVEEEVRDEIQLAWRNAPPEMKGKHPSQFPAFAQGYRAALRARPAQAGEAVAWQVFDYDPRFGGYRWHEIPKEVYDKIAVSKNEPVRPLYTSPPASGDAREALELAARLLLDAETICNAVSNRGNPTYYNMAEAFKQGREKVRAALTAGKPTHHHVKTGGLYIKVAAVIDATNGREGQRVVIYRNLKGQVFVREENEFNDGRFEEIMISGDL